MNPKLESFCDQLGLNPENKKRVSALYRVSLQLRDPETCSSCGQQTRRRKRDEETLMGACIYIITTTFGQYATQTEISDVTGKNTVTIRKCVEDILHLPESKFIVVDPVKEPSRFWYTSVGNNDKFSVFKQMLEGELVAIIDEEKNEILGYTNVHRIKKLLHYLNKGQSNFVDIDHQPVQIITSLDSKRVWVNSDSGCLFRASNITELHIKDRRE